MVVGGGGGRGRWNGGVGGGGGGSGRRRRRSPHSSYILIYSPSGANNRGGGGQRFHYPRVKLRLHLKAWRWGRGGKHRGVAGTGTSKTKGIPAPPASACMRTGRCRDGAHYNYI